MISSAPSLLVPGNTFFLQAHQDFGHIPLKVYLKKASMFHFLFFTFKLWILNEDLKLTCPIFFFFIPLIMLCCLQLFCEYFLMARSQCIFLDKYFIIDASYSSHLFCNLKDPGLYYEWKKLTVATTHYLLVILKSLLNNIGRFA